MWPAGPGRCLEGHKSQMLFLMDCLHLLGVLTPGRGQGTPLSHVCAEAGRLLSTCAAKEICAVAPVEQKIIRKWHTKGKLERKCVE